MKTESTNDCCKVLEDIKSQIEWLTEAFTEDTSPVLVRDSLLEDPPEYKDMRNCIYDIYKKVYEALGGSKTVVKEGWYKGELLSSAKDKMKQAKSLLVQASDDIRRAMGEDSWLFSRVDSNANDIDDTLYAFDNETVNIKYDDEIVDESRDAYIEGHSEWFDDYGNILKPIPMACILDCSGKGRKDDNVQYWLEELNFCTGFPVNKAVEWLHEFGAWEDLDLLGEVAQADINDKAAQAKMTQWIRKQGTEMDDGGWYNAPFFALKTLASRVLWIFCCDIKEQAEETTDEELEEVGLPVDVDEWKNAEWELFQTELGTCSLNH